MSFMSRLIFRPTEWWGWVELLHWCWQGGAIMYKWQIQQKHQMSFLFPIDFMKSILQRSPFHKALCWICCKVCFKLTRLLLVAQFQTINYYIYWHWTPVKCQTFICHLIWNTEICSVAANTVNWVLAMSNQPFFVFDFCFFVFFCFFWK